MARTIESPGVEINELDLSNISTLPVGTNILVQGFAAQGPTDELVNVTSIKEFEKLYGAPTVPAEKYFYQTAKEILNSPGRLIVNRLPYGDGTGAGTAPTKSALFYPFVPVMSGMDTSELSSINLAPGGSAVENLQGFVLGAPIMVPNLSSSQINEIANGTVFGNNTIYTKSSATALAQYELSSDSASVEELYNLGGAAGIIVINNNYTNIEDIYTGYYIGINDNYNIRDLTYDRFKKCYTRIGDGDYTDISSLEYDVTLKTPLTGSSTGTQGSISEIVEVSPAFSTSFARNSGVDYQQCLEFSLWKVYESVDETQGSSVMLRSYYNVAPFIGSFDRNDVDTLNDPYGGKSAQSIFIEDVTRSVPGVRPWLNIVVNPMIKRIFSKSNHFIRTWQGKTVFEGDPVVTSRISGTDMSIASDELSAVFGDVRINDGLFAIGPYAPTRGIESKVIGNVVQKIERGLSLAENVDMYQLELVLDAGLSTINAVVSNVATLTGTDTFDDEVNFIGVEDGVGQQDWMNVFNVLNNFCSQTRKDCMCIVDPLRHIFVQNKDSKTLDDNSKVFSTDILEPMKKLVNTCNSSYAAIYGNWVKAYEVASGTYFWAPFSGYEAAIMARMDALLQPWYAPAGLNNGIIRNIVDIAIEPNQRERDLLYRYGINPITVFPRDGFVVFGQKTLQAKPSAFDRINVRRLFLFLEKATRQLAKYFVFEPNTVFTRNRFVNVLTPIFELAKRNQGVYDYLIVCDERNNDPDTIDRNELVCDIYIKPVRTAEFILVNFIATRTGANFEEIISGTGA